MAHEDTAELLWRLGETAMAWRDARDATEADALVATYHDLLRLGWARAAWTPTRST